MYIEEEEEDGQIVTLDDSRIERVRGCLASALVINTFDLGANVDLSTNKLCHGAIKISPLFRDNYYTIYALHGVSVLS